MKYGDLVITTAKRVGASHMVTDEVNGGVRTSCGMFLAAGKHRPAHGEPPLCNKCTLHAGEQSPARKLFTEYARLPAPRR